MSSDKNAIAIVGMACRFPGGASTPEEFWHLLREGRDAVTAIDPTRWSTDFYFHPDPGAPGKTYTFAAGTLPEVDGFDADFFGISPREACQLDPQQRLLLELAWEALEDGGQLPERIAGTDCSVYVGISATDYGNSGMADPSAADGHFMAGNTLSMAANRISYALDLRGPSMALDTACSASLVALHQACRSMWEGEATSALAAGVNLLLNPFSFVGFSKASMLSPTGRCRAFDADASGYVRAEGGAVLFLKPLAQAEADGDPIHAVIVGTGVNSDGHTQGITVPSTEAQEALLERIYTQAGVEPAALAYLETHGTGTQVGDPQETAAIGRAFGIHRARNRPVPIGSVKTNIGHLEPASGLAGVVKVALALKHRAIPPSLHFDTPNPHIPFDDLNLKVVTALTPLAQNGGAPLYMGVNSTGFGGANAHVLLRDYHRAELTVESPPLVPPLFVSARSEAALRETARRCHAHLAREDAPAFYDAAWSAAFRRQQHAQRLAVWGRDRAEVLARLAAFAEGEEAPGVVSGEVLGERPRLALLFSGNGSQWAGMGRGLLAAEPLFREQVEAVDALLEPLAGYSVVAELTAAPEASRLHLTEVAQPALFALQVGLVAALRARGVQPEAVLGHSVGEVAAAWAAGALSLEQAVQVIHERSTAQALTRGQGRMAAIGLPADALLEELDGLGAEVELAGINSPGAVTVSGPLAALQALEGRLAGRGVFFRLLDLDYAFHSRCMDAIEARILERLAHLRPAQSELPFVSTVSGGALAGEALGAAYWWENIRKPVRLDRAVATLAEQGFQVFLEVGPHPILQGYVRDTLRTLNRAGRALPTLQRDADELARTWESACTVHVLGGALERERLFPAPGRYVPLPTYPWQRERHWYPETNEAVTLARPRRDHTLLGYRLDRVQGGWEQVLDTARFPYLGDHVVGGSTVFPGTGFVELALEASAVWFGGPGHQLEGLEIRAPLVFEQRGSKTMRALIAPEDGTFTVHSRSRLSDEAWTVNAVGRLAGVPLRRPPPPVDLEAIARELTHTLSAERHYTLAHKMGLAFGPAFQGVARARASREQVLVDVEPPAAIRESLGDYVIHPSVFDACFQGLIGLLDANGIDLEGMTFLPTRIGRLVHYGTGARVAHGLARFERLGVRSVVASFQLLDEAGGVVAELEQCRFRHWSVGARQAAGPAHYEMYPLPKPRPDPALAAPLARPGALAAAVAPALETHWRTLRRARHYAEVAPLFDALVSAFAYRVLRELAGEGGPFTLDALTSSVVDARHAPLLGRLLAILEEDGLARRESGAWALEASVDLPDADDIWRLMMGEYPEYLPELVLAGRCGTGLAALLRGELEPEALTASARSNTWEHLFESAPTLRMANLSVRGILERIVRDWPPHRRLRVLEIGAGHTGLAAHVLPVLPAERCDYVLTHPDEEVLARAGGELGDYPFAGVAPLDAEADVGEQGFAAHDFDVVIVSHALHRCARPAQVLANARRLLRRDGLVLLAERRAERFTDLVWGVHPEWWRPGDGARPVSSLRGPGRWQRLLAEAGFDQPVTVAEPVSERKAACYVVLARNPAAEAIRPEPPPETPRTWMLLVDRNGESGPLGRHVAKSLRGRGHRVVTVRAASRYRRSSADAFSVVPGRAAHLRRVCETLHAEGAECQEVVHLMGLSLAPDPPEEGPLALQERRCLTTVHLVQGLGAASWATKPRLWLVSTGGAALEAAAGAPCFPWHVPSQSPLQGLGRVLMNEHPELACRLVDLQVDRDPALAARLLLEELHHPDDEDEIIVGEGARYVTRMRRAQPPPGGAESASKAADRERASRETQNPETGSEAPGVRLDFDAPGSLANLRWQPATRRAPGPGEVAVRPRAAGLNFRDVMYAMGLLSDEAVEDGFAGPTLGMECAGDVVAVGPDVAGVEVGDPVICFGPSCFGSQVVTRAAAVSRKPEGWSYEQAATVPAAFFTAYYALKHLAQLQPGERVLIHGAAGGVGIAAIQCAHHVGAEIFATAGTAEKREFLRLLGVDHVLDSRSLAFADEVLEITGGEGVDVVLNSLAGEAVTRNLAILRPFGRFLELGKRDFYENSKVGLRPFRNNITYFGIDADQLMVQREALAGTLFREVMALFEEGALRPLVHRVYPAARVTDAFRHMQQSRHIGKIVIALDDSLPAPAEPAEAPELRLRPDASYLVSGGLGGFGLATARWLVARGARSLVLVGRRGAATPEAAGAVAELEAAGASVHVVAADVTDEAQVERVFRDIRGALPPLRGVVHAAGVLDDTIVANLEGERLVRVLGPKIQGAWHLHRATHDLALDFFVLYSSIAAWIGNPGQSNYVAANAYLESLARYRRNLGLPALAVAWGPLGDVGYLAEHEDIKDSLEAKLGGRPLDSARALDILGRLLASERAATAVVDFDWRTVRRLFPVARAPKFSDLTRHLGDAGREASDDIHTLIADLSGDEVRALVTELLTAEVAQILRLPAEKVDVERSLPDMGMDSLMGVELHTAVEQRFGVDLPAMALTEGATVARIAGRIADYLTGAAAAGAEADPARAQRESLAVMAEQHGIAATPEQFDEFVDEVVKGGDDRPGIL